MRGIVVPRALPVVTAALLVLAQPCLAADTYLKASVDSADQLVIVDTDGRSTVVRKERDQVGFDKIALSEDGRAVGWVALYPNCCTSYPIPLKLMVYTAGRSRTFTGNGLPVWQWRFRSGGTQVAFEQETVHGGIGTHYELRDVATGRLVAEWSPTIGLDNQPLPNQDVPAWVAELNGREP